jgi:hypothetical protein
MKESDRYLKLVQWSEEDACYIGTCPGLMLGGVHGDNEIEVYAELCEAVEEPEPTAKAYSGQFKLNVGKTLHKALSLAALQAGESLNNYCVKNLKQYAPPYNVL